MRSLPKIVADTKVGETVDVVVWRDNTKKTLMVKVGVLEDKALKVAKHSKTTKSKKIKSLGLTVSSITNTLRKEFNLPKDSKGLVVVDIDENGPAREKGINRGDLIVEVGQKEVDTPEEAAAQIEKAIKQNRRSVLLYLEGKDGIRFVPVRIKN